MDDEWQAASGSEERFRKVKRVGRKEMQLPDGAAQPRRTDNTLVKASRADGWIM